MLSDISREKIRSRMIKNASQLWGVQVSDISAFDPLVNMLIGAFAGEVEKVYHEMESSNSRILGRLSKLLIPEVDKGAMPAHAILHATGIEAKSIISANTQFYFQKRVVSKESTVRETYRDLYFTPIVDTPLFNGDIKYIVHDRSLISCIDAIHRDKVAEGTGGRRVENNAMWVAVDLSDRLETLNGMSFFFDWITSAERAYFIRFLPTTHWSLNGVPLHIESGLPYFKHDDTEMLNEPELDFDVTRNVGKEVANYYKDRFINVSLPADFQGGLHQLSCIMPEELLPVFHESEYAFIQKKLFWFKIVFPPSLSHDVVENIFCSINAFPVINRRFNELSFRLQPQFNIIPLVAEDDLFFSINSVKSADGNKYGSSSIADTHKMDAGLYVVRKGGVERFDTRNASELLNYLLELMRDESAAFAVYGQEMIASNLRDLNQILNLIGQKLGKVDNAASATYIVIKPKNQNDVVFIEFWSTAGEFANNHKLGTRLSLASGSNVSSENLMLLTNTLGGRDGLSESETLNSFRNALLSRSRVVSEADIIFLCQKELGKLIREVKIKKGLEIDDASFSGFKRTIDVLLYPTNPNSPSVQEWYELCRNLQVKLEQSAAVMLPLRVKLATERAN
ncbi:MAG: hypothetical protein SFW35_06710 [Chitinophagales bacterium]|nr:hypothetical protein [Chitinophagales bacterium]